MIEFIEKRQENSKRYKLDSRREQLVVSIGAIHYRDDYADRSEQWKDIDLTWEGNRITKAPYELTRDDKKFTIRNKRTGDISTIEPLDRDIEVVPEFSRVRFVRVLKSDKAPKTARFKVTGNFIARASDEDGELPVESTLKDGILTETLKPDRAVKYPVRIDPTFQVTAGTDDCVRSTNTTDSFSLTGDTFRAGYTSASFQNRGSAARFLNVTIPAGSSIISAFLLLTSRTVTVNNDVNTRLRAEANITPATFSDSADFDARVWSSAPALVNWDAIPAWSPDESGADTTSPDIAALIQAVIDLPGWASGNPMVILWDDFEQRSTQSASTQRDAFTYEGSTIKAPQLVITVAVVVGSKTANMAAKMMAGGLI